MKDNSEFVVILDRSGSMQCAKDDHVGGLRSFVDDQRQLEGNVRFTLIQFDSNDPCEVVYDRTPIEAVGEIDLIPRGGTPLLDAIGQGVAHFKKSLGEQKPDQIVVMIITDGHENASREFKRETIKALIQEHENDHGWTFLYLGANVDAFAEAAAIGTSAAFSAGFANNKDGTEAVYRNLSAKAFRSRTALQANATRGEAKAFYEYTDEERKAQNDAS